MRELGGVYIGIDPTDDDSVHAAAVGVMTEAETARSARRRLRMTPVWCSLADNPGYPELESMEHRTQRGSN